MKRRIGIIFSLLFVLTSLNSFAYEKRSEVWHEAGSIVGLLKSQNYDDAEKRLGDALKKTSLDRDGRDSFYALCLCLVQNKGLDEGLLTGWCAKRPNSYFAFLIRGIFYVDWAWLARGSDWAYKVTDNGWTLFAERLTKAKSDLLKARDLNPKLVYPFSNLIKVCTGLGLPRSEMESYFRSAVQIDPAFYGVYESKLRYLMPKWHGSLEDMWAFAREAAAQAPRHSAARLLPARVHWELANRADKIRNYLAKPEVWTEIEKVFSSFFKEFPGAVEERCNYADFACYVKPGKEEILAIYAEAQKKDETHEMIYYERGRFYDWKRDFESAILDYTTAIELAPDYDQGAAYVQRGYCYFNMHRYAQALADLKVAVTYDPVREKPYMYMGMIYNEMKKYGDAIACLTKAIELNSDTERVYSLRGYAYLMTGEYGKAIQDFGVCIKLKPENPDAYHNRAWAYKRLGDMESYRKDKEMEKLLSQK